MKLPFCSICNYSFQWRELIFIGLAPKKCPKCDSNQYVTAKRRRQGMWITPIVVLIMFFLIHVIQISLPLYLFIGITIIVAAFLMNPFFLQFTDKEESLF